MTAHRLRLIFKLFQNSPYQQVTKQSPKDTCTMTIFPYCFKSPFPPQWVSRYSMEGTVRSFQPTTLFHSLPIFSLPHSCASSHHFSRKLPSKGLVSAASSSSPTRLHERRLTCDLAGHWVHSLRFCFFPCFSLSQSIVSRHSRFGQEEEKRNVASCLFLAVASRLLWSRIEAEGERRMIRGDC